MKLSVILPCYNAGRTIGMQLGALARQVWSEQWEVIVVNNWSTDNSMEIVEGYIGRLPNLRVVETSNKRSRPYARNIGVASACGEAIAFCDSDDEVAPGWVSAMGDALSEKYDFVACRIDNEKLNPLWVYKGLGRHHPQCKGLQASWFPPYLPHAGGGTIGIKRTLHESIGGFDESLLYLEDTDYCFRPQLAGVQLHFVPDAVVHIRLRTTFMDIYKQAYNRAQYEVRLFKKYRLAASRDLWRWRAYMVVWRTFVKKVPQLLCSQEGRVFAAWRLGRQMGLLKGSLMYCVPPSIENV